MSNGKTPKFEDLVPVDTPSADDLKYERPERTEPPDQGWLAGTGRAVRGVATGVESTVDTLAGHLPGFLGPHDPDLAKKTLGSRPKPNDPVESFTEEVGEILPSFLVPETGVAGMVGLGTRLGARFPRAAQIAGSMLEGGVRGGIGGAMMPGDNTAENAGTGAAIGGGLRGLGAAAPIAIGALPLQLKNTLSAIATVAAANKMGLPWWAALMHPGGEQGSMFQQLYNANLADLAARYFRGATRINPAALGATGVKLKDAAQ